MKFRVFRYSRRANRLDCTLGYGGHTLKMLEKLNHTGHMYALDIDPIESVKTKERL